MNFEQIKNVYFIGAGGIGMSALVRYFLAKGKKISGYDRVETILTKELNTEGAQIHYVDDITLIPSDFKQTGETLVVYTPAVPSTHNELTYFRDNGYTLMKRSAVLGLITNSSRALCVAGTHGKTTTSSMIAHLLKQSHVDCNAFLGGILKNYHSNLLLSEKSDLTVIEADEYDRSFHRLKPYMAVITSADPDHLDIYGTAESYRESFEQFTSLISSDGVLIIKKGIDLYPKLQKGTRLYTYSVTDNTADYYAENQHITNGEIVFDLIGPSLQIRNIQLGVPIQVNVENGVAAMAIALLNGVTVDEVKEGMRTFAGPERRFDFRLKTDKVVLIDDYAHHPEELRNSITSVKALYAGRKVTGIFQPHLYSRTRDFLSGFADSLSLLDELILLDIYPAREEPIPGVTSQLILDKVTISEKKLCTKEELLPIIQDNDYEVVLMLGAGDIDKLVEPVRQILEKK